MTLARNRTRSEPIRRDLLTKYRNGGYFDSMNTLIRSRDEEMDDYVTPNFRRRIKAGEIINNSCLFTAETTDAPPGGTYLAVGPSYTYHTEGGNLTDYHQTLAGSPFRGSAQMLEASDMDSLMQQAKQKAIAEVDATPEEFMEDLFELRQTIRFIRNPIKALTDLSKSFNRDVRKLERRGKKIADAVGNTYLTYRFAFGPLVRSTYSALDAHVNWNNYQRPRRRTARGRADHEDIVVDSPRHYWNASVYDQYDRTRKVTTECRAQILYEVSNPVVDAGFRLGLRFKDIPSTLWAVMPYSFMVDRVLDITSMVKGVTNLLDPRVTIVSASQTSRLTKTNDLSFVDQVNGGYTITVNPDKYTEEFFQYNRDPWVPTVSDTIPVPTLGQLVKDAKSISDLLALVNQRVRF